MSAEEQARRLNDLASDVAGLKAGEKHGIRDRELIREDLAAVERRILKEIADVDNNCAKRFKDAAEAFAKDQTSKRTVTVAWIGGAFLLAVSIVNSVAALTGGGHP